MPIAARVLIAYATSDPLIPVAQATGFGPAQLARNPDAYVDTQRLDGGDGPWVHSRVAPAALERLHRREQSLVEPLLTGAVGVPARVRLTRLRQLGLHVLVTCPSACRIAGRLVLGAPAARRQDSATAPS